MPDAGFPASLWRLYDTTGIRPEYAVATLNAESGINSGIVNSIGCVGINQLCPQSHSIPSGYASWTASQQMDGVVTPMWASLVRTYGPVRSGARLEQGNWLPATLATAKSLDDVVYRFPSKNADSSAFDPTGKGYATVQDVGNFLVRSGAYGRYVQGIIAAAYALRPGETPRDAVWGDDFSGGLAGSWGEIALVLATAGVVTIAGAMALRRGLLRW